jgi:transcriptional regulator with XRE-family HTH domain
MTGVSKLDYILKSLDILGIEVASYLGTNATTVSKWRNGQRKIPYKNGTARKLSAFILRKEKERNSQVVSDILKTLKEDINLASEEQQVEALSQWFTEKKPELADMEVAKLPVFKPKNGYNTNVSIFLGEAGVDEAITHFFDYVLRLSPGKTIYILDNSGINWTTEDKMTENLDRINNCMRCFHAVSRYGHTLVVIECDMDVYRPYHNIFRWMERYLLHGVEAWIHPIASGDSCKSTTFLVDNEVILQCISHSDFDSKPHGMLYTNKETVNFFSGTVRGLLRKARRLFEVIPFKDTLVFLDIARKSLKPNRHIFMLNPSVTLQIIDIGLLQEILEVNNVPASKTEACVAAAKNIRAMQAHNRYSCICDLDALENFTRNDCHVDSALSAICETRIVLSKALQRKIVDSVMRSAMHKSNNLVFATSAYQSATPNNLSILVQEDGFIAIWDAQKYQKRLYSFSLDVISGFYRYADDFKSLIPQICKTREWADKQLVRIRSAL